MRARIGAELDERSQWQWWAARVHRDVAFRNCGVYGQRTDEIALRLELCAARADALIVQGGINDVAQGRSVAAAAENVRAMIGRGRELGLPVAVADVLPWNGGYPRADGAIEELNGLIATVAIDAGVRLLPFHDTLLDPKRPGRMRDEWTDDLDHPNIAGYRRLGEVAFLLPD